jgi:hypothetical protein
LQTFTVSVHGSQTVTQRVAWYGTHTFFVVQTSFWTVTGTQRVLQTGTVFVWYSVLNVQHFFVTGTHSHVHFGTQQGTTSVVTCGL